MIEEAKLNLQLPYTVYHTKSITFVVVALTFLGLNLNLKNNQPSKYNNQTMFDKNGLYIV